MRSYRHLFRFEYLFSKNNPRARRAKRDESIAAGHAFLWGSRSVSYVGTPAPRELKPKAYVLLESSSLSDSSLARNRTVTRNSRYAL